MVSRGALRRRLTPVAVLLGVAASRAVGQGSGEIELPRIRGQVTLDGFSDEAAWSEIDPLPLTMYRPVFRGTPSRRTEIRIAYDDEYIYAAGRFFDDPGSVRVNSLYRDRWSGDDAFAVFIDTYNDNENAVWFMTTPAGMRADRSIEADGASTNSSWNTFWDVATRVTEDGWFAEIRIPLSSLRFEERNGQVVMGLTTTRLRARSNERVTFPAIDPQYGFRQPSVMQDVVLRGVTPRRPAYVTPYLLSGVDREVQLLTGGGHSSESGQVGEVGADLRYALSDNLNLDLSLNTDFAQVEADDQQINFTRFPLFFPEKRQFFQERAGVFSFDMGAGGRVFHSRRIGLAEDRTPIRILGGARAVARADGWDVGVLDLQTAERDAFPTENLGVVRVRRRLLNEFSYAGAILTARASGQSHNVGAGVDAVTRVSGDEYFTVRAAGTFDDGEGDPDLIDRSQIFVEWDRRVARGLSYRLQYNRAGVDYRPELGFLGRRDFSRFSLVTKHTIFTPESPLFRNHAPAIVANLFLRNGDGSVESALVAPWWEWELKSGSSGWFEVVYRHESVDSEFSLGDDVPVPVGSYHFVNFWINYTPGTGPLFRVPADVQVGTFYDGWRGKVTLEPTWNVSRHLELSTEYEFNRIRFPERDTGLDTHLARLRVGTAASVRLSATAFLQYNSVDDRVGMNFRLRYNFREGTDLWLVYDERLIVDQVDRPGELDLPLSERRALRLKFTYTWEI